MRDIIFQLDKLWTKFHVNAIKQGGISIQTHVFRVVLFKYS